MARTHRRNMNLKWTSLVDVSGHETVQNPVRQPATQSRPSVWPSDLGVVGWCDLTGRRLLSDRNETARCWSAPELVRYSRSQRAEGIQAVALRKMSRTDTGQRFCASVSQLLAAGEYARLLVWCVIAYLMFSLLLDTRRSLWTLGFNAGGIHLLRWMENNVSGSLVKSTMELAS